MEAFHARLRRFRKKRGLTMKEVAEKLKVPLTTYREWEYGRAIQGEPYLDLAAIFETSVYELLAGKKAEQIQALAELEQVERHLKNLRIQLGSLF
jgi:transcriptional regulator with XRE-family HTH domain